MGQRGSSIPTDVSWGHLWCIPLELAGVGTSRRVVVWGLNAGGQLGGLDSLLHDLPSGVSRHSIGSLA